MRKQFLLFLLLLVWLLPGAEALEKLKCASVSIELGRLTNLPKIYDNLYKGLNDAGLSTAQKSGLRKILGELDEAGAVVNGAGSIVQSADELASFVIQNGIRRDIDLNFVITMAQGRRDLIEGFLLSTKEVVEGKTLSQLFQHFNIPSVPSVNSLSSYQVRIWYKYTKGNIGNIIDKTKTLEIQAKQAFDLRNTYRTNARNYMKDRKLAEYLQQNEVNQVWESFIKKTEDKLIKQGIDISNRDVIWNEIIDNSMHGREDVDKLFKLYDL